MAKATKGKTAKKEEPTTDYTIEEQLVCALAREFGPDDNITVSGVLNWTFVAEVLAQRLYAPQISCHQDHFRLSGSGCLVRDHRFPWMVGLPPEDFVSAPLSSEDIFAMVTGGRWNIVMQPVQVDKHGNCNLALIGDPQKPKKTFVGSRGLPDNSTNAKRCYFSVPDHTNRVFVEKVDFRSSAGYGPERLAGDIPYGAVHKIFTNLCVFDIDPKVKQLRLASVNKGITVEQVLDNTGFKPIMPTGGVPETCIPTEEELRMIREIVDSAGINRLDHGTKEEKAATFAQVNKGTGYQHIFPGRK
ncbi:MAG: CoA-transferase [Chloroflexota bacterium]|nr:CoA-transferase [Chloroflexota bacterium]